MTTGTADLFSPPGEPWVRVSPRLVVLRRAVLLAAVSPLVLVTALLAAFWHAVAVVAVLLLAALVLGWGWWVIGRSARAWGYAERADDLLVTRGILYRQLVVVPYGRMQFVDVSAGPLDRRFGLSTVQLHTAAAATDARIPGLVPAEAARLRDRLAARGEAHSAGL